MLIVDNYHFSIMDPMKLSLKHKSKIKTFADFFLTEHFTDEPSFYGTSKRLQLEKKKIFL